MSSLIHLADQIELQSFLWPFQDLESLDLKDCLLELASELRSKEFSYEIAYYRPDQPDYRLRSKDSPIESAPSHTIHFLDPGRRLFIQAEGLDESTFYGMCAELTVIGEADPPDQDSGREAELNLLTARTFQAELYAEFQRWERYQSPFGLSVICLSEGTDWKPAGRALKHVGSRRDLFGRIHPNFLMGLFPSREVDQTPRDPLEERLSARYSSDKYRHQFIHIPTDCSDWSQLQQEISELENIEERDFVGSHED